MFHLRYKLDNRLFSRFAHEELIDVRDDVHTNVAEQNIAGGRATQTRNCHRKEENSKDELHVGLSEIFSTLYTVSIIFFYSIVCIVLQSYL